MTMKTLLTAAAALALIGGAAHAGEGAKKSKPADSAQMQDETGKAMTTPGADADQRRHQRTGGRHAREPGEVQTVVPRRTGDLSARQLEQGIPP